MGRVSSQNETLICEKEKGSITPNSGGVSAPELNSTLNSRNPSTSTLNSTPNSAGMTTGVVSPENSTVARTVVSNGED